MTKLYSENFLVNLIDDIAPINNAFRLTKDPVLKIEYMWDIGSRLDKALTDSGSKLHELLHTLYDPHGKKMAYMTRDLGSYSYRVYRYFPLKADIRKALPNLRHYTLFREAVPLLFNDKYQLTADDKSRIFGLIQSSDNPADTTKKLKRLKQSIQPIKNPRNQRAAQFQKERIWLSDLKQELVLFYKTHESLPSQTELPMNSADRKLLVKILMVIASDTPSHETLKPHHAQYNKEFEPLLKIANSNNQDRARFRKWAFDARSLLSLAEILHGLESEGTYNFVRRKNIA